MIINFYNICYKNKQFITYEMITEQKNEFKIHARRLDAFREKKNY